MPNFGRVPLGAANKESIEKGEKDGLKSGRRGRG